MKTVTKRELNQQTAAVLAQVKPGKPVVITERGVPRWRIVAAEESDDPYERLLAQGKIKPASKNPPPWPPRDYSGPKTPADVDALIQEMKGDW